ncbi:Glu/Leu/Phe/Val dehydrogenase [Pelomyxa schiedti]|nr:Glu/Leu/Phe/Val dehydrogenase [Pelomyxa schiedti]
MASQRVSSIMGHLCGASSSCCTSSTTTTPSFDICRASPQQVASAMLDAGVRRAYVAWDEGRQRPVASHPMFDPLADLLNRDPTNYKRHEAFFIEVGQLSHYLHGAFIWRTDRGAAAGGVRLWQYDTFAAYVTDGLRLAIGMGRKNALAGIWWGGGKGVIARPKDGNPDTRWKRRDFRDILFMEYGCLMSSLRGCYVTAEDLGVKTVDCDRVFARTRFTTCISDPFGGSGNPGLKTGWGIACGMEAALNYLGRGGVAGKKIAIMGCGNVATSLIGKLLEKGVGSVIDADMSRDAVEIARKRFAAFPNVQFRVCPPGDYSILYEEADVVSPCAVGGVINSRTIPNIRAKIICGPANNQLEDDERDDKLLKQRGIRFVVDFVVNRMGIVNCCNEQYGHLDNDPAVDRHFDINYKDGIYQVTQRVLQLSDQKGITEVEAANQLADEASRVPHPIWGPNRWRQISAELVASRWDRQPSLPVFPAKAPSSNL